MANIVLGGGFSMSDFAVSSKGDQLGYKIVIPETAKPAIQDLVNNVLIPLSSATGWKTVITSGYRDDFINRLVGGAANSQHLRGEAADCTHFGVSKGTNSRIPPAEVYKKIIELGLPYDQVIVYPTFTHISHKYEGEQRGSDIINVDRDKVIDGSDKLTGEQMKKKKVIDKKVPPYTSLIFKGSIDTDAISVQESIDFLREQKILSVISEKEFLEFGNGSKTNFDTIVEMYDDDVKESYKDEISNKKPPFIIPGTLLYLPNKEMEVELQKIIGSELFLKQTNDFSAYWSANQKKLLQDPEYVPWDWEDPTSFGTLGWGAKREVPFQAKSLNIKIWVYSKAKDSIFDISPWVRMASTTKPMGTGSFNIDLVPTDDYLINTLGEEFVNSFSPLTIEGTLNDDWFSKYFQQNDIVFIRYEKLKKEGKSKDAVQTTTKEVPLSDLDGSLIWDMIGLVDEVATGFSADNTDYTVSISGRDLMKLFIEDGSYFIPLKFVEGSPERWFYGGDPETSWFKRNVISGSYDYYFAYEFQKIKNVIWFVINQLSNIGIVDNKLFAHSARQKKKLPVEIGDDFQQGNTVNGIWQIIQCWVDDQLEDRRIVDRSLTNPEGTLMDFFNKVCQPPFVEIWGDTWGSGFDLIVRQPPFTKSAIQKVMNDKQYISVSSRDLYSLKLSYDERAYAWYRVMPQNAWLGSSQFSSLAMVPIVYLEEFVERFGNKRCITNDIYLSERAISGKEAGDNNLTLQESLTNDLLYTVETNSYLPFTRRGTITLNGDRRIKVGTFVVLEPTNELFYVNAVNNTITFNNDVVDRVTVITVERGMKVDYLRGKNNYFNIVDVDKIRQDLGGRNPLSDDEPVPSISSSPVNKDSFDFFIKRKMYD